MRLTLEGDHTESARLAMLNRIRGKEINLEMKKVLSVIMVRVLIGNSAASDLDQAVSDWLESLGLME